MVKDSTKKEKKRTRQLHYKGTQHHGACDRCKKAYLILPFKIFPGNSVVREVAKQAYSEPFSFDFRRLQSNCVRLQSPSMLDVQIPHLSPGPNKLLYLETSFRFCNTPYSFFGARNSLFKMFPFNSKAILEPFRFNLQARLAHQMNVDPVKLSLISSDSYLRIEQLAFHYIDALHIQFYTSLSAGATILGHHRSAQQFMRHAILIATNTSSVFNNFPRQMEPKDFSIKHATQLIESAMTSFTSSDLHRDISYSLSRSKTSEVAVGHIKLHPVYNAIISELISVFFTTTLPIAFRSPHGEILEYSVVLEFIRSYVSLHHVMLTLHHNDSQLLPYVEYVLNTPFFQSLIDSPTSPFHYLLHHPQTPSQTSFPPFELMECLDFLENSAQGAQAQFPISFYPFSSPLDSSNSTAPRITSQQQFSNPPVPISTRFFTSLLSNICPICIQQGPTMSRRSRSHLFSELETTIPQSEKHRFQHLVGKNQPEPEPRKVSFVLDVIEGTIEDGKDSFLKLVDEMDLNNEPSNESSVFTHIIAYVELSRMRQLTSQGGVSVNTIQILYDRSFPGVIDNLLHDQKPTVHSEPLIQNAKSILGDLTQFASGGQQHRQNAGATVVRAKQTQPQVDTLLSFITNPQMSVSMRLTTTLEFTITLLKAFGPLNILNTHSSIVDAVASMQSHRFASSQQAVLFRILFLMQRLLIQTGIKPHHQISSFTISDESDEPRQYLLRFFNQWTVFPANSLSLNPVPEVIVEPWTLYFLTSNAVNEFENGIKQITMRNRPTDTQNNSFNNIPSVARLVPLFQQVNDSAMNETDSSRYPLRHLLTHDQLPISRNLAIAPEWKCDMPSPERLMSSLLTEDAPPGHPTSPFEIPPYHWKGDESTFAEEVFHIVEHLNAVNQPQMWRYSFPPSLLPPQVTSPPVLDVSERVLLHHNACMALFTFFCGEFATSLSFCNSFTLSAVRVLHQTHFINPYFQPMDLLLIDQILKNYCWFLFDHMSISSSIAFPGSHVFPKIRQPDFISFDQLCHSLLLFLILLQVAAAHPDSKQISFTVTACLECLSQVAALANSQNDDISHVILPPSIINLIPNVISSISYLFTDHFRQTWMSVPAEPSTEELFDPTLTLSIHGSFPFIFDHHLTTDQAIALFPQSYPSRKKSISFRGKISAENIVPIPKEHQDTADKNTIPEIPLSTLDSLVGSIPPSRSRSLTMPFSLFAQSPFQATPSPAYPQQSQGFSPLNTAFARQNMSSSFFSPAPFSPMRMTPRRVPPQPPQPPQPSEMDVSMTESFTQPLMELEIQPEQDIQVPVADVISTYISPPAPQKQITPNRASPVRFSPRSNKTSNSQSSQSSPSEEQRSSIGSDEIVAVQIDSQPEINSQPEPHPPPDANVTLNVEQKPNIRITASSQSPPSHSSPALIHSSVPLPPPPPPPNIKHHQMQSQMIRAPQIPFPDLAIPDAVRIPQQILVQPQRFDYSTLNAGQPQIVHYPQVPQQALYSSAQQSLQPTLYSSAQQSPQPTLYSSAQQHFTQDQNPALYANQNYLGTQFHQQTQPQLHQQSQQFIQPPPQQLYLRQEPSPSGTQPFQDQYSSYLFNSQIDHPTPDYPQSMAAFSPLKQSFSKISHFSVSPASHLAPSPQFGYQVPRQQFTQASSFREIHTRSGNAIPNPPSQPVQLSQSTQRSVNRQQIQQMQTQNSRPQMTTQTNVEQTNESHTSPQPLHSRTPSIRAQQAHKGPQPQLPVQHDHLTAPKSSQKETAAEHFSLAIQTSFDTLHSDQPSLSKGRPSPHSSPTSMIITPPSYTSPSFHDERGIMGPPSTQPSYQRMEQSPEYAAVESFSPLHDSSLSRLLNMKIRLCRLRQGLHRAGTGIIHTEDVIFGNSKL
ncbi:hypothetical protein BLNAU_2708 [Blattamonas nauphoetae]|uniref:Uncharacterized protein n=1 Tax=Blattamonas nauphoetae TaxID=2049346 RepID=A0ABQ9YFM8_9EUKA|nr:hypothetical protein BLNAU_2708 [Blattamonas nauphoetae]